jgi:predicted NBD/HSP70 family sugar kinase
MTIMAGGKPCVCGNRGCWEKYASASSAASLYTGDRAAYDGSKMPRFVEIVARAEAGETRAQRTLAKIGEYLGIGIANVIMGIGVQQVIVSGRLVTAGDISKNHYAMRLKEALSAKLFIGKLNVANQKGRQSEGHWKLLLKNLSLMD